jgi:hypothetical protein
MLTSSEHVVRHKFIMALALDIQLSCWQLPDIDERV